MLILNADDIYNSIEPIEIIEAVERAFEIQSTGAFKMPDRMHINEDGNTHLVMPCLADHQFCTKLVSVNPENKNRGLPIITGAVQLVDQSTGTILAIQNGSVVTALRTGAVGAVGIKYLTDPDTCDFGIIGTGIQGLHLIMMINAIRNINKITIYDYEPNQSRWFKNELIKFLPESKISFTNSKEELLKKNSVIITATTSPTPVLPEEPDLLIGKTYICVGSFKPIMGELPRSIFSLLNELYIDVDYARKESGDVSYPLDKGILRDDQIIPIHNLISGNGAGTGSTKVFKSVGMALFDLTTSQKIYKSAINKGIGTELYL